MPREQPILETPVLLTHVPETPIHAVARLSRKQPGGNYSEEFEEKFNVKHPLSISLCARDGVPEKVSCDPTAPHASRMVIRRDSLPTGTTIHSMLVRMRDTVIPIPLDTDGRFVHLNNVQQAVYIDPHPAPPPSRLSHIRIEGTNPLLFDDPRYKLEIWFREGEVQPPAENAEEQHESEDDGDTGPSKRMRGT